MWEIFIKKTALYPIRFESSATPLWEPEESQCCKTPTVCIMFFGVVAPIGLVGIC
jgi:hypothetical protein